MEALRHGLVDDRRKENLLPIQNGMLLHICSSSIGKEVLIETKDGNQFRGIFAAPSPDMAEIGLFNGYKVTRENEGNLLPRRADVTEKMQFCFDDVVCFSVLMENAIRPGGFATDRDYHAKNGVRDGTVEHFEAWECDEEDEIDIEHEQAAPVSGVRNGGGWCVKEMFDANSKMGVVSTYDDNLSQYTNTEVVDDPLLRQKAEEIARQIEQSADSKRHALLENDDDERDLNKYTTFTQERSSSRPLNKRAEGLRGATNDRMSARYGPNNNISASTGSKKELPRVQRDKQIENVNGRKHVQDSKCPSKFSTETRETPRSGVENLRMWRSDFNMGTKEEKSEETMATDTASPRSVGNAWTKGPPSSLVSSATSTSPANSSSHVQNSSPSPAKTEAPQVPAEPIQNYEEKQQHEVPPSAPDPVRLSQPTEQEVGETVYCGEEGSKPPGDPKPHDTTSAVKDFQFNLNAPSFVPKSKQVIPQESQVAAAAAGVPLTAVPVQTVPPPMLQPMVIPYAAAQQVYQPTQQFQYGVVRAQQGPQQAATSLLPGQQRRGPQQVYVAAAQYSPQVYQHAASVQSGFYSAGGYAPTSVPPPQQPYVQQMQMAGGQVSMGYMQQQRFPAQPAAVYAVPQNSVASAPRYPTPQQGIGSGHETYQGGSQSMPLTQPNGSQPPTPGPGVPQGVPGVPSPAQPVSMPVSSSPAPRPMAAASPHVSVAPPGMHGGPPQFIIAPAQAPMYYGNQMMYYQGQMPMQQQHSSASDAHQEQQVNQQQYDQYAQYMPTQQQGAYYPQGQAIGRAQPQHYMSHAGGMPGNGNGGAPLNQSTQAPQAQ